MTDNQQEQLLTSVDKYVSRCSMRLRGIFMVCDQQIKVIVEGRTSDWYFDEVFNEIGTLTERIGQISSDALQDRTVQNEIRATLVSFPAYDRHYESFYLLIRDIWINLGECLEQIEKYVANQRVYDDFIRIRYAANFSDVCDDEETREKKTRNILHILSKLHSSDCGRNLLGSARHLRFAIKSVIPPADLHKVIPVEEMSVTPTSTNQELEPTEPGPCYVWKGSKTDLAELVWALSKSGCITYNAMGERVTIDELTRKFETLFGLSINTIGLMQGRKGSFKAADDGITFTGALSDLVDRYVADQ